MSAAETTKKQFRKYMIQRIALYILVIVLIVGILYPVGWYMMRKGEARLAVREAKNLELVMHLLAVEAYGLGTDFYDSKTESGVSRQFEDEVRKYSGAKGDFIVTRWSEEKNRPEAFSYMTDRLVVRYFLDRETTQAQWTVDYRLPLLEWKE